MTRLRHRSKTNSRKQEDRAFRATYANENPFCERCRVERKHGFTPMDDIHHICGGRLGRWDLRTNLLSVCRPCHDWFEQHKTDGRIYALWIKLKKNELDREEFHRVSGMYLEGWLAIHQPTLPATRIPHTELTAAYKEST